MPAFQVVSEYTPSGDQPQAIAKLAQGIEDGLRAVSYTHLRAHETSV